jgi:HD domain
MEDLPTVDAAERYLAEGAELNPGPWVGHSRVVASAARAIAERDRRLDPKRACVLGLLHDIGRRTGGPGVADVRHLLDGYRFLRAEGFDGIAPYLGTDTFLGDESGLIVVIPPDQLWIPEYTKTGQPFPTGVAIAGRANQCLRLPDGPVEIVGTS